MAEQDNSTEMVEQEGAVSSPEPREEATGAGTLGDAEAPQEGADEAPESEHGSRAGRDAAKYRTRLREVEAERDGLQERVAELRDAAARRDLSDVLAESLERPLDLVEVGGVSLDDLRDADGDLDADLVQAATDKLLADRPYLARREPGPTARRVRDVLEAALSGFSPKQRRLRMTLLRESLGAAFKADGLFPGSVGPAAWAAQHHSSERVEAARSTGEAWQDTLRDVSRNRQ